MSDVLQDELRTYEAKRGELLRDSEGQFVLIHGEDVLGLFQDRLTAIESGYRRLGNVPFLVKQVLREEPVVTLATAFRH